MRTYRILTGLLLLAIALGLPGAALAKSIGMPSLDDQVVFGDTFTLKDGEVLDGDLVVFGGVVNLEEGSLVQGDVVAFGGTVDVDGEIGGQLVALGAVVSLGDTAVIGGDLVAPGTALSRAPGAVVGGQIITESGPVSVPIPDVPRFDFIQPTIDRPLGRVLLNFSTSIFWLGFRVFAISALAVLAVMFVPEHTRRTAEAVISQPVVSGGLGLLTFIAAPIVLIALAITIFLSPLSLLGVIVLVVAVAFGWIALGMEVGKRMSAAFDQEWALPVEAGLGTFLLSLVAGSIGLIPCIGWIAALVVGALGLGGVLLTRFGTQVYQGPASAAVVSAAEEPADKPKPKPRAKTAKKKEK